MKLSNTDLSIIHTSLYKELQSINFNKSLLSFEQIETIKKINKEVETKLKKYPGCIALANIIRGKLE